MSRRTRVALPREALDHTRHTLRGERNEGRYIPYTRTTLEPRPLKTGKRRHGGMRIALGTFQRCTLLAWIYWKTLVQLYTDHDILLSDENLRHLPDEHLLSKSHPSFVVFNQDSETGNCTCCE